MERKLLATYLWLGLVFASALGEVLGDVPVVGIALRLLVLACFLGWEESVTGGKQ